MLCLTFCFLSVLPFLKKKLDGELSIREDKQRFEWSWRDLLFLLMRQRIQDTEIIRKTMDYLSIPNVLESVRSLVDRHSAKLLSDERDSIDSQVQSLLRNRVLQWYNSQLLDFLRFLIASRNRQVEDHCSRGFEAKCSPVRRSIPVLTRKLHFGLP